MLRLRKCVTLISNFQMVLLLWVYQQNQPGMDPLSFHSQILEQVWVPLLMHYALYKRDYRVVCLTSDTMWSSCFFIVGSPRKYLLSEDGTSMCEVLKFSDEPRSIRFTFDSRFGIRGRPPRCRRDYLEIQNGLSGNSLGRFCSRTRPNSVTTSTNRARVRFNSEDRHGRSLRGFRLIYSSV